MCRAHCRWNFSPSISNFIEFERLRAKCLHLSRSKYKDYINSVKTGVRRDIRTFCSFVNNLNNNSNAPS